MINLGKLGEDLAVQYMIDNKIEILERNYRIREGEIDIIAMDCSVLVFAEVKTRLSMQYGSPAEAVDRKKQLKILKTAKKYIQDNELEDLPVSFYVIEVLLKIKNQVIHKKINLIKNAIEE